MRGRAVFSGFFRVFREILIKCRRRGGLTYILFLRERHDWGIRRMAWYEKSAEETVRELDTNAAAGISRQEAARRRARYGANETTKKPDRGASSGGIGAMMLPAAILAAAAVLCLLTKDYLSAAVVFGSALVTAGLKGYSLARIRRVLTSIAAVTAPMSTVVRDGVPEIIETVQLVPGDLVQLRAGDIIGADMRLVESISLVMDESILPGGFMGAPKDAAAVMDEGADLSSHLNMCYTGTVVRSGSGRAVVVATGRDIAAPFAVRSPYEHERRSTLNRTIAKQNKRAAVIGVICSAVILLCSLLVQAMSIENLTGTILLAATLAVSAIPSGLVITESALSAAGIRRLAMQGAVVKSLDAMDRLASLDTILAQKTGVISSDDMTVTAVWTGGRLIDVRGRGYAPDGRFLDADGRDIDVSRNRSLALTLIGGALCGDSDIEEQSGRWGYRGDPTEAALVTLAAKAGLVRADVLAMFPRVAEFPFEPERRRMTTIHKRGRQAVSYTKGAPELVIARSSAINLGGTAYTMTDRTRQQLHEVAHRLAEQGLRVIAVAYREFHEMPARFDAGEIESELVFAGLCGIDNRATPDSVSAFNLCAAAGIRTVIVTGDDPATAADLALSMGMSGDIFEGGGIDAIPLDELCEKMRKVRVCANVSPLEKRALVTALKHNGGTVAVTGTRASDAPALMAADIGVSIGANAPELTRDSADMVLEEAGYADVVRAVEESRRSFTALRSYCGFAFVCMFAQMLAVFALLVSTPPVQFSMLHLAWLNIFLALIPAFVIASEPGERDVMRRPPHRPSDPAYGRLTIVSSFIQAFLPTILIVTSYFIAHSRAAASGLADAELETYARTAAFLTMTLSLLLLAHSCRSERTSLIRLGVFSNRALLAVTLGVAAVLAAAVYIPALQGVFATAPVGVVEWLVAVGAAALSLVWSELYKGILRPILARSIREKRVESKTPSGGSLTERLFEKFEGDDPTQEDVEPARRTKRAAKKAARAAEPAEADAGVSEETPAAFPALEAGAEPEIVEPDEAEQAAAKPVAVPQTVRLPDMAGEDDAASDAAPSGLFSEIPDELRQYEDIIAGLPPELLEGGLPLSVTPENAGKADEPDPYPAPEKSENRNDSQWEPYPAPESAENISSSHAESYPAPEKAEDTNGSQWEPYPAPDKTGGAQSDPAKGGSNADKTE